MPQKTTEQILNELFSKINNVIAPVDPEQSLPPLAFVSLMLPGVTVRPQDYDISTSVGRDTLYRTMNRLPAVNKQYLDSGRGCSDMYQKILSAQPPADDPEKAKALEAQYQEAQDYLRTRAYKDYKNYRDDYNEARDEYLSILNNADLSDQDKEKKLRRAKREMSDAYQDWLSLGNKQRVEEALNTCARYLAFTPKSVFAEAARIFTDAKDPASELYPVFCTPSDWATAPDKLAWTEVILKQGSSESHLHKDVQQIDSDFSVSFSSGLWHAKASGGYHDRIERLNQSSTVDKLGISMEIARININRDWFNSALLTYSDATVLGAKRGSICSGSLADAALCDFPFLPTAFIVARNINIYNEFSHEEEQFMDEAQSWSASAEVGYGPFSLGNDTSSSHDLTDEEKDEFGNAVKITVGKGMQIIGFLNTILTPTFPGRDSNSLSLSQLTALGDFAIQT